MNFYIKRLVKMKNTKNSSPISVVILLGHVIKHSIDIQLSLFVYINIVHESEKYQKF